MNAQSIEHAATALKAESHNIIGVCETLFHLHEQTKARAMEVDEHARLLGNFVFQQRALAAEEPQQKAALKQARNGIKLWLGPILARDLWQELMADCEIIGSQPSPNEVDVFMAALAWLFDRPLATAPTLARDNLLPHTKTAKVLADLFEPLAILFGLTKAEEPASVGVQVITSADAGTVHSLGITTEGAAS